MPPESDAVADFEEFLKQREQMIQAAENMIFGVDQIKKGLEREGWSPSSSEHAATVLFNTMLMMMGANR